MLYDSIDVGVRLGEMIRGLLDSIPEWSKCSFRKFLFGFCDRYFRCLKVLSDRCAGVAGTQYTDVEASQKLPLASHMLFSHPAVKLSRCLFGFLLLHMPLV